MEKLIHVLSIEDCTYLDIFAKSLARGFLWREENGTTALLRRPLRATIGDMMGCSTSVGPEANAPRVHDFTATPLEHRCQRLLLRGLVLHHWTEIFHGERFRSDRYTHLMVELNAFGQELAGD